MGSVRERYSRNVIPSEVEGSFLHTGIVPYVRQRKNGKPFGKGARKSRVQGRFLAAPLMTEWGNGSIPRSVQRICL